MKKLNKGITLIALVITIIVLLILAGVTIATLTGDNGLLTKVGEARKTTIKSEEKEQIQLGYIDFQMASKSGQDKSLKVVGAQVDKNADNTWTVTFTKTGNAYILSADGKTIEEVTDTEPAVTYTVSFNSNGGSAVSNQTIVSGKKATIPTAPIRSGYAFKGWFSDSELNTEYDFNDTVESDKTLHAKWVQILNFTYNGNSYPFESGMTWGEYIPSSYNTYGFVWGETSSGRRGACDSNNSLMLYYEETEFVIAREDFTINPIEYFAGSYNHCCFDPESKVLTADGTEKNIEDITENDFIMSLNEETGEYVAQKVERKIIKHNSDDLVYINLSNGSRIGMRAYHPLLTTDGWKSLRPLIAEAAFEGENLKKLEVGDELIGITQNLKIESIEIRPEIENYDTYNLAMPTYHNYIINGIVVHNAPSPCVGTMIDVEPIN